MPTRDLTPDGAPCWIDLATSDSDRARDFYTRLFGWTYDVAGEEYRGYINCLLNGSVVAGMMQNTPDSGYPDGWTTYLASTDAAATAALADDSGGQTTLEPMVVGPMDVGPMGMMAVVTDPGGAPVGVWQAGQHAGFTVFAEAGAPVWHELHTRNYAASVAFYEVVFGWQTKVESDTDEFRFTTAEFAGEPLAGIMDAGAVLPEDTPAQWKVYFQVDDVDATLSLVEAAGGTVLEPAQDSPYGRWATVADSTGSELRVMTPAG